MNEELRLCPDCGHRSRFSLCSVCFTRATLSPDAYAHLSAPQLSRLYVAAREREEYFDMLTRDLWHQMKGPGPAAGRDDD